MAVYKIIAIFVSEMRKINRTYKFRLYPTKVQADLLARHFGCARFVYNYFLNQRKEQYRLTGKSDNYYAQAKTLTALKKQEATAWLKEVNSQTLQFAIRSLEVAYTNFFQKRAKFLTSNLSTLRIVLPFHNLHLSQVAGFSYPSSRRVSSVMYTVR